MRLNPEQGTQFAQMLVQEEEPLADINQVCCGSICIYSAKYYSSYMSLFSVQVLYNSCGIIVYYMVTMGTVADFCCGFPDC